MKQFFTFFALFSTTFIFSQSVITGTISDGEFNDPLPFANVVLKTADGETNLGGSTSDFDGKYSFDVTQGSYLLEFSYVGYGTKKITDIVVNSDAEVVVDVTLSPIDNALDEVVVTTSARQNSEQAVLALQKKSVNLMDGLSAQSIRKSGIPILQVPLNAYLVSLFKMGNSFMYVDWETAILKHSWAA